jgi:hypothetical protein
MPKEERMIRANRFTANGHFTRLHAKIREEDGAFTVSVRLQNRLRPEEAAWGRRGGRLDRDWRVQ